MVYNFTDIIWSFINENLSYTELISNDIKKVRIALLNKNEAESTWDQETALRHCSDAPMKHP